MTTLTQRPEIHWCRHPPATGDRFPQVHACHCGIGHDHNDGVRPEKNSGMHRAYRHGWNGYGANCTCPEGKDHLL